MMVARTTGGPGLMWRTIVLAVLGLGLAAPARACHDGSPAFVPYAGVCAADIGGEHEPGLALGVRVLRDGHRGGLQLTGGAEYLQKIGVGEVRAIDGGDGTVTSWGETEVTLHYAHGYIGLEYAIGSGQWLFAPYAGAGVSLLLSQDADPRDGSEPTMDLDWYDAVELGVHLGASAAWRRLLVDVQAAFGLGDLAEEPTGAVGRGGAYPMFTTGDLKARSVRVAAGWVF